MPSKNGAERIWTVSPSDGWVIRDEKGNEVNEKSKHTKEEKNAALVQRALVWGQVNQKDMCKPYQVQIGNRAILFDPVKRTYKEVKPKETRTATAQSKDDLQSGLAQTLEQREAEREQARQQRIYDQVVAQLKENGIVVHNKAEMDAFLKEHGIDNIEAWYKNYYIDIDSKSEWQIVHDNLFNRLREKSFYGVIARSANNWYLCDYFGDGSFKARAIMQIDGNEDFLNDFEKYARDKKLTFRNTEALSESIREFATRNGQYPNGGINVQVRRTSMGNAIVDKGSLDEGTHTDTGGSDGRSTGNIPDITITIKTGYDGTRFPRYMDISPSEFQELRTSKGELYGFVYNGEIYIDETKLSPNAAMHEYTHVWDNVVKKVNPKLWARGKELMGKLALWNEIAMDENYGQKWQKQGKSKEEMEDLIASEVHSRLVGENGAKLLDETARKKGDEGLIAKIRDWIKEVWK